MGAARWVEIRVEARVLEALSPGPWLIGRNPLIDASEIGIFTAYIFHAAC